MDFYAPSVALVIEVDGSQHFSEAGKEAGYIREQYLAERGLTVLRFTNHQVFTELD